MNSNLRTGAFLLGTPDARVPELPTPATDSFAS